MPQGDNNRKLGPEDVDEIVRRYTTPLPDGGWEGATLLGREFGVEPATVYRWLHLRGIEIRSAKAAHSGGRTFRPVKNAPVGEAPTCGCGCGKPSAWNRRKNRWNVYIGGHYRSDAAYKDEEWLRAEYEKKQRTIREIAVSCNVNRTTVSKFMRKFGITAREPSAAHAGRQVGDKNPAWKGGVAEWESSSDWKMIARQMRIRDTYTCQDCGEQRKRWGAYLHVHHIDENKLNNDPSNLVSLCAICHRRRHGGRSASG
jgi:hypothetical protein